MRGNSLVELTEHDNSATDIMVHSMYMCVCTAAFILHNVYTHNIWTPPRNSGGIPYVSTRFSLCMEMSKLTRDETAEPVSRDQILARERRQGRNHFPCSANS